MTQPLDEYRRRLQGRTADAEAAARRSRRLSHARVITFILAVIALYGLTHWLVWAVERLRGPR